MNDTEATLSKVTNAVEKLLAALEAIEAAGGLRTALASRSPKGARHFIESLRDAHQALGAALGFGAGQNRPRPLEGPWGNLERPSVMPTPEPIVAPSSRRPVVNGMRACSRRTHPRRAVIEPNHHWRF